MTDPSRFKDQCPLLARLSQTEIQDKAGALLSDIIAALPLDATIDKGLAISCLFTTLLHLTIRCNQYRKYPFLLWKLTLKFNRAGYLDECAAFLNADPGSLDRGSSGNSESAPAFSPVSYTQVPFWYVKDPWPVCKRFEPKNMCHILPLQCRRLFSEAPRGCKRQGWPSCLA